MNKTTTTMIIIMLLTITVVTAVEPVTPEERTNLQDIEYKRLLLEQHAKTQAMFMQELSKRDAQLETRITTYVDDNFKVLDGRIDSFIKNATFKLGMVFFSGLVLGGSILLLINHQLRRKKAIKKRLTGINEQMTLSGNTLTKIREETETVNNEPTKEEKEINDLKEQLKKVIAQKEEVQRTITTNKKRVEKK